MAALPNGGLDVQEERLHWALRDGRVVCWSLRELAEVRPDELAPQDSEEAHRFVKVNELIASTWRRRSEQQGGGRSNAERSGRGKAVARSFAFVRLARHVARSPHVSAHVLWAKNFFHREHGFFDKVRFSRDFLQ